MTINKGFYIAYITCPKCEKKGKLHANYSKRNVNSLDWCGPYFQVFHHHSVYDSEKYRLTRNGRRTVSSNNCYIGKTTQFNNFNIPYPDDKIIKKENEE